MQSNVKCYSHQWTNFANLDIVFPPTGPYDIRVGFVPGGSRSYVGTTARRYNQTQATMNFGSINDTSKEEEYQRVILHEFGHAIRMVHEQANPSIKILWNKPAVYQWYAAQNPPWTKDGVDLNVFTVYASNEVYNTPWDQNSIMEYFILPSWTTNGQSVPVPYELSAVDKTFAGIMCPKLDRDVATWQVTDNQQAHSTTTRFSTPYNSIPAVVPGLNFLEISMSTDTTIAASITNTTQQATQIRLWLLGTQKQHAPIQLRNDLARGIQHARARNLPSRHSVHFGREQHDADHRLRAALHSTHARCGKSPGINLIDIYRGGPDRRHAYQPRSDIRSLAPLRPHHRRIFLDRVFSPPTRPVSRGRGASAVFQNDTGQRQAR
ncbi:hypothetical protein ACN47E_002474 [Coniothyrium glycines]